LKYRPNATTLVNEAFLMYTINKTQDWLASLSEEDLDKMKDECRKDGRKLRATFRERCKIIQEKRREALGEKAAAIEQKRGVQLRQNEEIISMIVYYELWQTGSEIQEALTLIHKKKEKREALI
jgi:hypothetical protein